MKLGLLHGWLLEGSGSNIYVRSLAAALSRAGHDVHVICQEPSPENFPGLGTVHAPEIDKDVMPVFVADTEYPGFQSVKTFPELSAERRERYLAQWTAAVLDLVEKHGLEVLHANHVYPMPEIARRVKEACGMPYLVFPHGSAIEYTVKADAKIEKAAGRAIDAADMLVVGNQAVTERLYALYPARRSAWAAKHRIVSVGVDPALFAPVAPADRYEAIALLKEALATHEGEGRRRPDAELTANLSRVDWGRDKVLLYAGKLLAGKGVGDLLAAFARLVDKRAWLFLVGEGPERERLELRAAELGVLERVVFAGFLPHALYRHLLPCAHLAVFPSVVAEAYPLVLIEAISAGVLPAASYFEGLADGIDQIAARLPAELGPLMRLPHQGAERSGEIAEKLDALLARDADWGETLRAMAVAEYGWDAVAAKMTEVYGEIAVKGG